jgi:hypothetical protein
MPVTRSCFPSPDSTKSFLSKARGNKEEGRGKKEEGRGKREEGRRKFFPKKIHFYFAH